LAVAVVVVASVVGGCSAQDLSADNGAPAPVWSVAYTGTGELAVFTQRDLVIYDRTMTEERARVAYPGLPAAAYLQATDLSADGRVATVAWGNRPFEVYLESQGGILTTAATVVSFSVPSGKVLSTLTYDGGLVYGHDAGPNTGQLPTIRLSPAGDLLMVHGIDGDVAPSFQVREVDGGELVWGSDEITYPFVFSGDGALVYAFGQLDPVTRGLMAWDAHTGEVADRLGGWMSHALAGAADGRWLVGTGAPDTNPNGSYTQFTLWRTSDGTHTLPFDEAPDFYALAPMAMSPDGERWANLAQGFGERYEVHLWTKTGTLVVSVPTTLRSYPTFSPDGTELAVGPLPAASGQSVVKVYRASDGVLVRSRMTDSL